MPQPTHQIRLVCTPDCSFFSHGYIPKNLEQWGVRKGLCSRCHGCTESRGIEKGNNKASWVLATHAVIGDKPPLPLSTHPLTFGLLFSVQQGQLAWLVQIGWSSVAHQHFGYGRAIKTTCSGTSTHPDYSAVIFRPLSDHSSFILTLALCATFLSLSLILLKIN